MLSIHGVTPDIRVKERRAPTFPLWNQSTKVSPAHGTNGSPTVEPHERKKKTSNSRKCHVRLTTVRLISRGTRPIYRGLELSTKLRRFLPFE